MSARNTVPDGQALDVRRTDALPVRTAMRSERGGRASNEDVARVLHTADGGVLCLLADGLGGHGAGMLAATIAIESIERAIRGGVVERARLVGIVATANEAITEAQGRARGLRDMRTTLALLHLDGVSAWWLHCGDTRVYRYRDRCLLGRTLDHSVAQMQRSSGESRDDVAASADRHRLLRALGGDSTSESRPRAVREALPLRSGDRFVLCTDGWWEHVEMDEAAAFDSPDPESWLASLFDAADATGARHGDDATAIAVMVGNRACP